MQKKKSINKMFLTIIGILLAIIFVAPILILVNSSFKTLQEIYIDILAFVSIIYGSMGDGPLQNKSKQSIIPCIFSSTFDSISMCNASTC